MQISWKCLPLASLLFLAACGGGGGSGGGSVTPPPTSTPAPSALSYPSSPAILVAGQAAVPLKPTVTGTVTSYSIAPQLPAGLMLDSTTGVISGTPTSPAQWGDFLVTATNASGSTTAHFAVGVSDGPLGYAASKYSYTAGTYARGFRPNFLGGTVAWSISPSLPPGLAIGTDGSISGTPSSTSPLTTYTVTATAAPTTTISGSFTLPVAIAVEAPFLDLGHADPISLIRSDSQHFLTYDGNHWNLWDAATDASIASGDASCLYSLGSHWCDANPTSPIDLVGPTFVLQVTAGLEVRSSTDGHLLGTLPQVSWWRLASDGNYIVVGNSSGLTVWSASGPSVVFSRPGDYSNAMAFAAPTEVRVALGPAGQNVIERIAVPSGTSTTGPAFQGQFATWFLDGQNFLTKLGNTVWTYSKDSSQVNLAALGSSSNLGGEGGWFWTAPDSSSSGVLKLFAVGSNSATPAASYPTSFRDVIPSRGTLAVASANGITVVDISGATPTSTDYTLPRGYSTYASTSSSHWFVGNASGVVLDGSALPGQLHYLNYGAALSIAASATRIAIATGVGDILYFDATTGALQGKIPFDGGKIQLSGDGNLLATMLDNSATTTQDRSINVYTLPASNPAIPLATWPYMAGGTVPLDIRLALSGTALGQIIYTNGLPVVRQVNAIPGGAILWSDSISGFDASQSPPVPPIRLSPDGTLIAVSNTSLQKIDAQTSTNIFKNGTLQTAVPGYAVGWIDDHRLMVDLFKGANQTACGIYDDTGHALSCPATLPVLKNVQAATADLIYSPELNSIFSLTSGAQTWASGNAPRGNLGLGAVAGSRIVFASDAHVLLQSY